MPLHHEIAPGTRLGRWTVLEKLGQGGMGAVYRAQDPERGPVALKLVLTQNPTHLLRFEREARGAAAVVHENVARTFGLSSEGGVLVLALELLEGGSLRDLVRRQGTLEWREAARIAAGIARGLGAIHEKGLVHRDLKPANVLLDGNMTPKITDFGLVRRSPELTVSQSLTKTGEVLGTLAYMAPEQADSTKVDFRADLYSLGATLYELLSGKTPFEGSGLRLLEKHLKEKPVPVSEITTRLPPALDRLVLALLAKDPKDRPESAFAVADELEAILARGEGTPRGKAKLVVLALVLVLALGAAGLAFVLLQGGGPSPPSIPVGPPPPPVVSPKALDTPEGRMRQRYDRLLPPRLAKLASVWGHEDMRHAQGVRNVAFARLSGKLRVVSGGYDGHLKAWDPETGKEELDLKNEGGIRSFQVSGDGTRAVVGTGNGKALAWDLVAKRRLGAFEGHGQVAQVAVSISPDGQVAVSATGGSPVHLWRTADGSPRGEPVPLGDIGIWFLRFAPDGRKVVAGGNGGVATFDFPSGSNAAWSTPHARESTEGAFTRSGRLVTVGSDHTLAVQDLARIGQPLAKLPIHKEDRWARAIYGVDVAPDGKLAATGGFDGLVELWDLEGSPTKPRAVFPASGSYVLSVAFDPESGKRIAVGGEDGTVRLFDLEGHELRAAAVGAAKTHRGRVTSIALSKDSTQLLTANEDATVKVWDSKTGEVLATHRQESGVRGAALVESGGRRRILSLGRRDDDLVLRDAAEGSTAAESPATGSGGMGTGALAVSANGERAVVTNSWWTNPVGFEIGAALRPLDLGLPPDKYTVCSADLLPDGARAIIGREGHGLQSGNVAVLDLAGRASPKLLPGHPESVVTAVKFLDADGRRAVSCGDGGHDHVLRAWDVEAAKEIWATPLEDQVVALSVRGGLISAVLGEKLLLLSTESGRVLETIDLGPIGDRPTCCVFDPKSTALWVGTGLGCVLRFEVKE